MGNIIWNANDDIRDIVLLAVRQQKLQNIEYNNRPIDLLQHNSSSQYDILSTKYFKCPICRSECNKNNSEIIFGFKIDCVICLETSEECMKLQCRHGVCKTCFDKY